MKDFFISYTQTDKKWAEWIAGQLEADPVYKYTVSIQAWDFLPGGNFVVEMQEALTTCERTIAVLSAEYLASLYCQMEWAAVLATDPAGKAQKLLPVRIAPCEPTGLLKPIIYCDLVEKDEDEATRLLLNAAARLRAKPNTPVPYPGKPTHVKVMKFNLKQDTKAKAQRLLDILLTTYPTFVAQANLRDTLVQKIKQRITVDDTLEYEAFFARYYNVMNKEELQLHATMRGYTKNILHDYNLQAYNLLNESAELSKAIPSAAKLIQHLRMWLTKFDTVFMKNESMCLLYVGVEEQVPFPIGIENEIEKYLEK